MIDWQKIRDDFPVTLKSAYFLSAAMSPPPTPVFEAITEEYRRFMLDGDIHYFDDLKKCGRLYADLADLIHTNADNITFLQNTSTAMSFLALSVKKHVRKSFHIVSLEDEFPASTIGFEHQGIEMRYVRPVDARYSVEEILAMTNDKTLAVVASYVQYATGFRLDLETLGKALFERKIHFIVNATQGFPFYPLNVETMHIDALSASFHKWGLTGHIGAMFFTSGPFRRKFPSPLAGWLSVASECGDSIPILKNAPIRLHESAQQYSLGTSNLQTLLAFQTALNYMKAIGFENIRKRIAELTDYLIKGLNRSGIKVISPISRPDERSAIVAFTLGGENGPYVDRLAEKDIYVSLRAGFIRVALNFFNNEDEIDRLLDALRTL